MSTTDPGELPGAVETLRRQLEEDRLQLLANVGLVVALLLTVWNLPWFVDAGGIGNVFEVTAHHLYSLGVLLVLSWFTRTVSPRTLVTYWLLGVYLIASVIVWVGSPIIDILGSGALTGALILPFMEEALKALPVLLYFALAARRDGYQPGAIDGVLLGFAVGAGFAFNEDVFASRSVGNGWFSLYGLLFPTFAHIGGGLFGGPTRWAMGHGGWTALVGLGIGLAFLFRRWWYVSWIPMVGAFSLVTWDHMMVNYGGPLSSLLDLTVLRGELPILVFLLGLFAVVPVELGVLYWTSRTHDRFPPIRLRGLFTVLEADGPAELLLRAQAARDYSRYRRSALYALWIAGDDPPDGVDGMAHNLEGMASTVGLDLPPPEVDPDAGGDPSGANGPPPGDDATSDPGDDGDGGDGGGSDASGSEGPSGDDDGRAVEDPVDDSGRPAADEEGRPAADEGAGDSSDER